ncbi:MAG: divalent-cation tolerance protein CutA [Alphaproteobacteria bacterium]
MAYFFIYTTFDSKIAAKNAANILVREKFVACVNIINNVDSVFLWKGKIEEVQESILITKTHQENVDKVIKKIKEIHNYECPAIVVLPILNGNPEYLDWIKNFDIK